MLISGEPGIGKSRLTAALSQAIENEPLTRLHYFCSPHQQDSALYPFIAQLERAAGFFRDDTVKEKLDKLRAVGSFRNQDVDWVGCAGTGVVFRQFEPETARLHADDRIDLGVVTGRTIEDLHSNYGLFERAGIVQQGSLHDKTQKPGHPLALFPLRTAESGVQGLADLLGR